MVLYILLSGFVQKLFSDCCMNANFVVCRVKTADQLITIIKKKKTLNRKKSRKRAN